jgi:hypothetical protein
MDETLLEIRGLKSPGRAADLVEFFHRELSASSVDLEIDRGSTYCFRVSASRANVLRALLESNEFRPRAVHSNLAGPLLVELELDPKPKQAEKGHAAADQRSEPTPPLSAAIGPARSPLLEAFEHLDVAFNGEGATTRGH